MNPALVSAIVLSHNRKEETIRCLEALFCQDYAPLEVLVLDNGSIDGSADSIEASFGSAKLIRLPKNYGDWEGRDIALQNCTGDYVVCIDNDAVMDRNVIGKMISAMERDPLTAVVEAQVVDPDTGTPFSCRREAASVDHYRSNFLGGAALIRRDVLRRAGGFPHYLLGGAEAHLALRFLDMGYRILHSGQCIIYHRQSPKNRIAHQRFFLSTKQRLRAYMSHYPGLFRPLIDLIWKLVQYSFEATRRGFASRIPVDAAVLMTSGLHAWFTGKWRIQEKTLNLVDYLEMNIVSSVSEYERIPTGRRYLGKRAVNRLFGRASIGSVRTRPARRAE